MTRGEAETRYCALGARLHDLAQLSTELRGRELRKVLEEIAQLEARMAKLDKIRRGACATPRHREGGA